ncbi:MAG: sugar ABC transporter permease, partial [Treponema sp.]|nr:sugar ABC transporter permease [Treponema sp.]
IKAKGISLKVKSRYIVLFLFPTVSLFILIYALPLGTVFVTSLTNYHLMNLKTEFVGFVNYVQLFHDHAFYQSITNTFVWIILQCSLHVGLGVLVALLLYKKPLGWKFIRTVYMIPNIISNAAIAIIFLNIFNPTFGVINSLLRAIGLESLTRNWLMDMKTAFPSVTITWFVFAGYTTTIILAYAISIDEGIIEAARVDGASNFQLDMLIMLPLLKKIIGTTSIMAGAYMLQMFDLIYLTTLGGPGRTTTNLPLFLYSTYKTENNYAYANTVGVVIILVGIFVIAVLNRIFRVNKSDY